MRILLLLFVALNTVILTSGVGQDAETPDGNHLLVACREYVRFIDGRLIELYPPAAMCAGLVRGVVETAQNISNSVCLPDNANIGATVRIVINYLNDSPDRLDERDTLLILRALVGAFPCR